MQNSGLFGSGLKGCEQGLRFLQAPMSFAGGNPSGSSEREETAGNPNERLPLVRAER
jgi:hypothetical protein